MLLEVVKGAALIDPLHNESANLNMAIEMVSLPSKIGDFHS